MSDDVTLVNPEPAGRNLPATSTDTRLTVADAERRPQRRQPVSVAYLPLALVAFITIAFAMAMWTFLAATT
ncbi:MAG: hypothetical protein ABI841_00190 [Chloroflexota bacterium]